MGFNCGIVGLPNVGKSTLFNALTQTAAAEAMNYPFCTIEPNVGRVGVPDPRLFKLATIAESAKIVPAQMEIVDIAGLVKGASNGEGLGNQFLGYIRGTDAILHIVRCFENNDITHVNGNVDPIRDIEIVETELILADLESLKKRESSLSKKNNPELTAEKKCIPRLIDWLEKGNLLHQLDFSVEENNLVSSMHLITKKPVLYVCNIGENEIILGNALSQAVESFARSKNFSTVTVSAAIEAEIAVIQEEGEKLEYIQSLGLTESGLSKIIRHGYNLLDLITFFTVGPTEAHAWTITEGSRAPTAAGRIHSEMLRGFICAETISYDDYVTFNGETGAKAAGKIRLEGKEYIVKDGDIFHFRFNV
ncbi:MAG: redox-regulated ATPase YchF [Holosporaceae bacterium]|jgi:GTP-binding protein YchF|nr:redox-regulated ATPase YchF [Holosporaceae bacterium]